LVFGQNYIGEAFQGARIWKVIEHLDLKFPFLKVSRFEEIGAYKRNRCI
jgi:hypothetical protein